MFASNLFRDETELRQFLADVEQDLRHGRPQDAVERVDFALGVLDEFGHPIAAMCRAYPASAIRIHGWDKLASRLASLDGPDQPITAISIDLSVHGEAHADSDDAFAPYLETNFYSDNAFPFSTADRITLCAGYGNSYSDWQGNFEDIDNTIHISGIGRLNFAIDALDSGAEDPLIADAIVFAVAYRAVAIHQAVRMMIEANGLPRPLTVIVGSNGSDPFFDAPVITATEYVEKRSGVDAAMVSAAPIDSEPDDALLTDDSSTDEREAALPSQPTMDSVEWSTEIDAVEEAGPDAAPSILSDFASPSFEPTSPSGFMSGSEIRRQFAEPSMVVEQKPKSRLLGRLFGR